MRFYFALILYLFAHSPSLAQEQTESGFPSGSAIDTGFTYQKKLDISTGLLNKKYTELILLISEYDSENNILIDNIKKQHEAWLKYYPSECDISGTLSATGGSWPSTYSMQCYVRVMDEQVKKISSITKCINDIHVGGKLSYEEKSQGIYTLTDKKNACLYQLGSMILHYDSGVE
jgi:uncharacterized protein YecT (DUF1311 family)